MKFIEIILKNSNPTSQGTLQLHYTDSHLMLFEEIITLYSDIHTKPINELCRQNAELFNVITSVVYPGESKHSCGQM
jgi:hypothetical protein